MLPLLTAALFGCAAAALPSTFLGTWQGIPEVTPLGPYDQVYTFVISEASDGSGWLMEDVMGPNSDVIPDSVQRFYVNSSNYYLTYCGVVKNFFSTNPDFNATVEVELAPLNGSAWTDKTLTWCMVQYGCDVIQWTMTLQDENTLISHVQLYNPVNHLKVTLKRASEASAAVVGRKLQAAPVPPPHVCDYSPPELDEEAIALPDGHPPVFSGSSSCPYYTNRVPVEPENPVPAPAPAVNDASASYSFCYVLNFALNITWSWTYNAGPQTLDMSLSAPMSQPNQWIAIGFQPQFPYMKGADIVLGYQVASGQACVRTMYSPGNVGTPVDDPTLSISNSNVVYNNGVLTVSFSRPLASGHNPLPPTDPANPTQQPMIMWGLGPAPASCSDAPGYHGDTRGVRVVSFFTPSNTFNDFQKC